MYVHCVRVCRPGSKKSIYMMMMHRHLFRIEKRHCEFCPVAADDGGHRVSIRLPFFACRARVTNFWFRIRETKRMHKKGPIFAICVAAAAAAATRTTKTQLKKPSRPVQCVKNNYCAFDCRKIEH